MTTPMEHATKSQSVAPALLLAFIPSVCLLIAFAVFASESNAKIVEPWLPWAAVLLALVCGCYCFISSFLLFRRNSVLIVSVGILFLLLLNGMISFFFGCVALLSTY